MFINITVEKWKINQIQLVYVTGVTASLTLILFSQCRQTVNVFKANFQLIKYQIKIFDHNKSKILSLFYCNLQNCSKIRKQAYLFQKDQYFHAKNEIMLAQTKIISLQCFNSCSRTAKKDLAELPSCTFTKVQADNSLSYIRDNFKDRKNPNP